MSKRLTPEQRAERESARQAERQAHIDAIVAAAPRPTPEQLEELARLLLPSLTRQGHTRLAEQEAQAALRELGQTRYMRESAADALDVEMPLDAAAAKAAVESVALINSVVEAAGLLQSELATALGVTEGRVSQVLNGDGNVRVSTLARFLRAAGYELDFTATPCDTIKKQEVQLPAAP